MAVGAAKHLGADEFVAVRHLGVRRLLFRADFLRTAGVSPEQTVSELVRGAGMEPLIPDGATVLVNRAATSIINGQVYAFLQNDEVRVKRLYRGNGGFITRSENVVGTYPPIT